MDCMHQSLTSLHRPPRAFDQHFDATMPKKIVLKVSVVCAKCTICYMRTVAKLGVTSIALDMEKSTMTVVGEVDPALIVKKLRKARKPVEIDSVGPLEEEKPPENKDENDPCKCLPPCCRTCSGGGSILIYDLDTKPCSIL